MPASAFSGFPSFVILGLAFHGALFTTAIGAFYRYGDRTDSFAKSLAGLRDFLGIIRRDLVAEFEKELQPFFRRAQPNVVLDAGGAPTYQENATNPVGGEEFREFLDSLLKRTMEPLSTYRALVDASDSWCSWAMALSWTLLAMMAWEFVALVGLALWPAVGPTLPQRFVFLSFVPGVACGVLGLIALSAQLRHHDTIMEIRRLNEIL